MSTQQKNFFFEMQGVFMIIRIWGWGGTQWGRVKKCLPFLNGKQYQGRKGRNGGIFFFFFFFEMFEVRSYPA